MTVVTKVNSAFHPSGVDKWSTGLLEIKVGGLGGFTYFEWRVSP